MKSTINVDRVVNQLKSAAMAGLMEGARAVETVSASRAPIETGRLRNSVNTTMPLSMSNEMTAVVSFNVIYARYQHEGVHFNHPRGGQAKFLSQTIDDQAPLVRQIIANHVRGAL